VLLQLVKKIYMQDYSKHFRGKQTASAVYGLHARLGAIDRTLRTGRVKPKTITY